MLNKLDYGTIEESVLACLLIEPNYFKISKLESKHFKKYKFAFNFFQECYKIYGNLDINIMFSAIKGTSEKLLSDAIEKFLDIFVVPTHFRQYEELLIRQYSISRRDEFLKEAYNKQINLLNLGKIDVTEFKQNVEELYIKGDNYNWR